MENKDKKMKRIRQLIFGALGIGGIVATYFLARALSGLPGQPEPVAEAEAVETAADAYEELIVIVPDDAPPPAAALTEEEIFSIFAEARNDTVTEDNEAGEDTEEQTEAPAGPIDFEALWEVNKDVYAWISVAGTIIDYPVLQHPTDDSKYLNYNIDGSYGLPGCIYTEKMNAKDFSDPNTVIYGHNMRNGTMFAKLHEFRKSDFFEKNRDITIYLPDGEIHYKIFAAYVYDDRHLMYSFDFKNPDVYASYLKMIFDIRDMNANVDKDMVVTKEDKIITLVTCISNQGDKRLLVQAVRIENEQE